MNNKPAAFGIFGAATLLAAWAAAQHGALNDDGLRRLFAADHPAIAYYKTEPDNRVERLAVRLEKSRTPVLQYDPDHGYLPALLAALDIPVSSQALVFSKTSFQAARISPRLPRAIYHNEDTYVGFVRSGEVLELAVMDPHLGTAFYSLDQRESSRPLLRRRGDECLQCHHGAATAGVPGVLVRSICPDRTGTPVFPGPSHITDHRSPFKERWGGWYATGKHGTARHLGNVFIEKGEASESLDVERGANLTNLQSLFDAGAYLTPTSDIPSLMVMEHQTRLANLMTRAAWSYRVDGKVDRLNLDEMVRYILFSGEAKLEEPVQGASTFAADFSRRGKADRQGRSLWQLDLQQRLTRYRCSFLIYSEMFAALPRPVKDAVLGKLAAALRGGNSEASHLPLAERKAVDEILSATLPGWPKG